MSRPNIVVICSDQHHPRMTGYRGHPQVRTPNLDALAADGAHFTNAYCTSPICVPSRMSFTTGKYANEVGSWFLYVPLDEKETTWPRRLEASGYRTTMLGKLDLCGPYQDAGFGEHRIIERRGAWARYPRDTPFVDRLNGYVRPDKRRHIDNSGIRAPLVTDGRHGHDDRYGFYDHDRIVTDWAVEYLRDKGTAQSTEDPWALYVGLLYPHWPYCVPEEYFRQYFPDNVTMPHDAHFPNDALHPPLRHFQSCLGIDGITEDDVRRTVAAYYGMITALDDNIGRIIGELKAQGRYEDTYIIYLSDHGESLGEHGLFYKQCSYEGSVGVPVVLHGPGVEPGTRFEAPVSLIDLYPTILDLAGVDCEPDRPGRSWRRLVAGTEEPAEAVFAEFHGNFFTDSWYLIRTGDLKYTWYGNARPTLFDIAADPGEMHDLADDPAYADALADCERILRGIVDPEATALRAKRDLGLIGPDGEDYTRTLTVADVRAAQRDGRLPAEPPMV